MCIRDSGKEVVVRVTDRGPFARGRIIDLSWGAANMLDILSKGVATVIVEPIEIGKIPYRPKDKIDLPEIDFDVSDAGYSFIQQWNTETPKKVEAASKQTTKEKAVPSKTKTANKEEYNSTPPTDKGKEENNKPKSNKWSNAVSYTHLRAPETVLDIVCRLLLVKKNRTPTY